MDYQVEQTEPGSVVLRLRGKLAADTARGVYEELLGLARTPASRRVALDFAAVERFDSPAAAALCLAMDELRRAGKQAELRHLSAAQRATFALVEPVPAPAPAPPPEPWIERLGGSGLQAGRGLLQLAEFMVDTGAGAARVAMGRERLRLSAIVEQSIHLGVRAVWIVALLTFLTGLILAFQSAYQLQRFGAAIYMAEIVSLGMVREFASLMTAIILAGRSSSAIAAELGTMAVRDEIAALRTTGIDPISFLVLPRLWAVTLVQPALTVLAMAFGLAGGLLVAWMLGLPTQAVFHRMQETLTPHDFALGLSKSLLFAWIVGCTGCYMGLTTSGGASNVGRNTTLAVVAAIFLIVVVDSAVTTVWTLLGYGDL